MNTTKMSAEQKYHIDLLDDYELDENLEEFHIFHLYASGYTNGNGYNDSMFFTLDGYNKYTKTYNSWEGRDRLMFGDGVCPKYVGIYADGSTIVLFDKVVGLNIWQAPEVVPA